SLLPTKDWVSRSSDRCSFSSYSTTCGVKHSGIGPTEPSTASRSIPSKRIADRGMSPRVALWLALVLFLTLGSQPARGQGAGTGLPHVNSVSIEGTKALD